ncbi:MAG: formylglycine-generating enzyme family protein [Cyanobacteria bacterium P01_D01_bin.156]
MQGQRDQIHNRLNGSKTIYLLKNGTCQQPSLWASTPLPRSYSRRQALKLLGLSAATAMVTAGCHSTPSQRGLDQLLKISRFKTIQLGSQGEVLAKKSMQVSYFDEPALRSQLRRVLPLRMVQIPAGKFLMGSPATELNHTDQEGPQQTIQVPTFYMGAFAVTQRQYEAVMDNNPAYFVDDQVENAANLPVEQVSWQDAELFCKQLSELTGRIYRLPSEAEWEYACRAGTTTPFCYGESITTEIVNFFADFTVIDTENYEENYRNIPVAADSFWPNAFGLYNMHGNVLEWCADDYHETYQDRPSDAKPWLSGDSQASKVMRGGSWFNDTPFCRSASRDKNTRTGLSNSFGFRVVCEAMN